MASTDIGEYIVGAYLKVIQQCDVIDYNVRPPGGKMKGLGELDVIGLKFNTKEAYICEVTTHLGGVNYSSSTFEKIKSKHARQKEYATENLSFFEKKYFMFWAPYVPEGILTQQLGQLEQLELIINQEYSKKIKELRAIAKIKKNDMGNIFFRTLQILEHLR